MARLAGVDSVEHRQDVSLGGQVFIVMALFGTRVGGTKWVNEMAEVPQRHLMPASKLTLNKQSVVAIQCHGT
jgi:hypothetical protein